MNINYREAQLQMFQQADLSAVEARRPRVLAAQLVLSAENIVILTICSILVIIFAFSLGVERGRKVAMTDGQAPVAAEVIPDKAAANDFLAQEPAPKKGFFAPKVAAAVVAKAEVKPLKVGVKVEKPEVMPVKALAVVAPKPAQGTFTVQVASYKSEKSAQREVDALRQKGFKEVYALTKGKYVIVCVGKFDSKTGARLFTEKLKSRYQDTSVRSL